MKSRDFTIALMIGGLIGVLAWLILRRRDEYVEYPEEPEPNLPWWTYTSMAEPWVVVP